MIRNAQFCGMNHSNQVTKRNLAASLLPGFLLLVALCCVLSLSRHSQIPSLVPAFLLVLLLLFAGERILLTLLAAVFRMFNPSGSKNKKQ